MDILDKMKSQIGDDVQYIFDHEALFKAAADEIEQLRAHMAELEKERDQWEIDARRNHEAAEAAEAMLSKAVKAGMLEGAKVKPLVWEDFGGQSAKSPAFGMANYLIAKWDNRGFELCESYPGYGGPAIGERFYATLDAAKDAAKAHYEDHILNTLDEPNPETIARIVAQVKEGTSNAEENQ